MTMLWYDVIAVLLHAVILPAKCCISLGSGGCSLSYGGRLAFGGEISAFGDQLLFGPGGRKRIFIFQQPPGVRGKGWSHPYLFPGASGRGRIWISNGKCRRSQSEQGACPLTEDGPCLDSKMPCDMTPPSYSQDEPLTFSDISPTSLTVTWPVWDEATDRGFGPIVAYIIQFKERGTDNFQGIRKGLGLSHHFQNLTPETQYEFRVIIVRDHPNGDGPSSRTQQKSTPSKGVRLGPEDPFAPFGPIIQITGAPFNETIKNWDGGPNGYNPVRNLTASLDGVGKLTLTWSPPELDNTLYVTVGYVVKCILQKHVACLQSVDAAEEIHVNDTEVTLTDLEDYAIYNISVTPRTVFKNVNIEDQGQTVSIVKTTLPNAPVASLEPVKGSRSSSPASKLIFSWNRVTCENQNGPEFTFNCVLYLIVEGRPPTRITEVNVTHQSHVFPNLKPCGRYRLEVTPQNKMTSGATETIEASTSTALFGVVQNFSFTPIGEQEHFTVEWQSPRNTLCPVTSYTLTTTLQKQQACPHCVVEEAHTITDIQESSCLLDNLLPYATYMVSITTHGNEVNMTGSTFEDVVTTPKRAPASSPTVMFDDASSTQTSLTFVWDPVPCEELNGVFIQYTYSLEQTGSDVIISEGSILDQSQNRITFTGLLVCTNYTFNVRVDNDAFNGLFNTVYGATKLAIPGNNTNLTLTTGTSDTCTDSATCLVATWQKPRSNGCPIAYQIISLHLINDDNCRDTSQLISSFNISNSQFQQVFTGIKPNSLYRATVAVANSVGSTEETQELRTRESYPSGAPQYVVIMRPIRGTKIKITWEEPECGHRNGNIVGYTYMLFLQEQLIREDRTSKKWHYFQGLQRGTRYSFTVRALTALGPGPEWRSEDNELIYFSTRA